MKVQVIKIFILLALLGFVLTFNKSRGQAFRDRVWSAGPELGVNFANYGRDANATSNTGAQGGASVTYSIRNTHAFTGKLLLSQRGAHFDGVEQTLNYLEVPVLARMFLNTVGVLRPNLFVGPTFSFLAGASNKAEGTTAEIIKDPTREFRAFDFGLTAGLGLNYEIAPETRLLLDARYLHGFTDITKAASNINNKVFGISLGASFGL